MSEAIASCTFEDFLAGEQRSQRRHEFVGSRVYVMSGGTERHDLAAGIIFNTLSTGAFAKGCRPFMSNRLVRTRSGNAYHPDLMVACGSAPDPLYETDPTLIVEVLSSSTSSIDRREKAVAYAAAPSLRLLLLVVPNALRIEVAHPVEGRIHDWVAYSSGDVIGTDYGDIVVDTLYDALDAAATT